MAAGATGRKEPAGGAGISSRDVGVGAWGVACREAWLGCSGAGRPPQLWPLRPRFLAHRVKLVMALDAVGLVGTSDIVCGGAFTPAGDFQKMLFFIAMERLTLACVGSLFF